MKWKAWLITALVITAALSVYLYLKPQPTGLDQSCISAGGTVTTRLCCNSASDFPNTCLIGACGCSPENSHQVKVCDCGSGKCWDSGKEACV